MGACRHICDAAGRCAGIAGSATTTGAGAGGDSWTAGAGAGARRGRAGGQSRRRARRAARLRLAAPPASSASRRLWRAPRSASCIGSPPPPSRWATARPRSAGSPGARRCPRRTRARGAAPPPPRGRAAPPAARPRPDIGRSYHGRVACEPLQVRSPRPVHQPQRPPHAGHGGYRHSLSCWRMPATPSRGARRALPTRDGPHRQHPFQCRLAHPPAHRLQPRLYPVEVCRQQLRPRRPQLLRQDLAEFLYERTVIAYSGGGASYIGSGRRRVSMPRSARCAASARSSGRPSAKVDAAKGARLS